MSEEIVFRPIIDEEPDSPGDAKAEAVEERKLDVASRRRGLISKLLRLRMAKRAAKRARASLAKKGAGRFAMTTGLAFTGLLAAGAVVARMVTGRNTENLGAQMNKLILGTVDDEARARQAARSRLLGDENLMRMVGIENERRKDPAINAQIRELHRQLTAIELDTQTGTSLIKEDKHFQVGNVFDQIIDRARQVFIDAWFSNGGSEATDKLRNALVEAGVRKVVESNTSAR